MHIGQANETGLEIAVIGSLLHLQTEDETTAPVAACRAIDRLQPLRPTGSDLVPFVAENNQSPLIRDGVHHSSRFPRRKEWRGDHRESDRDERYAKERKNCVHPRWGLRALLSRRECTKKPEHRKTAKEQTKRAYGKSSARQMRRDRLIRLENLFIWSKFVFNDMPQIVLEHIESRQMTTLPPLPARAFPHQRVSRVPCA